PGHAARELTAALAQAREQLVDELEAGAGLRPRGGGETAPAQGVLPPPPRGKAPALPRVRRPPPAPPGRPRAPPAHPPPPPPPPPARPRSAGSARRSPASAWSCPRRSAR